MIYDVVIHLEGDLPVIADLRALPGPTDVTVLCTNMRTTDGKRPTFIEKSQSWFVIPMSVIRFLEMHSGALDTEDAPTDEAPAADEVMAMGPGETPPVDETDEEPDESLLQRIRDI